MQRRFLLTTTLVGLAAVAGPLSARAGNYPERPVRIVVPYPPGGPIDMIGRLLAQNLPQAIGGQFYVENAPGAAGTIGARAVATAAPDGHTILVANENLVLQPIIKTNVPFDPIKSFVPISLVATAPMMIVVNSSVQAKTLKELIEFLKANPTKYNYASPGYGASPHLASERLFNLTHGLQLVHVPFQGAAPAVQAVLAGEPPLFHEVLPAVAPHIQQGTLRALAIASSKRSKLFPNVPTLEEIGVPDHEVGFWCGVIAPAGTPQHIVVQLQEAIKKTLALPEVKDRLEVLGFEVASGTGDFAGHLSAETERYRQVVKRANIKIE